MSSVRWCFVLFFFPKLDVAAHFRLPYTCWRGVSGVATVACSVGNVLRTAKIAAKIHGSQFERVPPSEHIWKVSAHCLCSRDWKTKPTARTTAGGVVNEETCATILVASKLFASSSHVVSPGYGVSTSERPAEIQAHLCRAACEFQLSLWYGGGVWGGWEEEERRCLW